MHEFIANLWIEAHPAGAMSSKITGEPVASHVTMHQVTRIENDSVIAAMSPDDADRLADQLHAAATRARAKDPT